jgi:hypothetical protein
MTAPEPATAQAHTKNSIAPPLTPQDVLDLKQSRRGCSRGVAKLCAAI